MLSHEGHQGIVRTKQLLRSAMWFSGMDKLVEKEIAQCMPCQVTVSTHKQEPLKPTQLPQEPWDKLATDLYGPLGSGEYHSVNSTVSLFPFSSCRSCFVNISSCSDTRHGQNHV